MARYIMRKWRGLSPASRWLLSLLVAAGVGVALWAGAQDADQDGMSDAYEELFELDADDATDAAANYDEDSLPNLSEAAKWTDPWTEDTDMDGFDDDADETPLSRAVIHWGLRMFISEDDDAYEYPAPQWWVSATKQAGQWLHPRLDVPPYHGWYAYHKKKDDHGRLLIGLDRAVLGATDVRMAVTLVDSPDAGLRVDLLDADEDEVAVDVCGDLMADTTNIVIRTVTVPLADHPDAAVIRLRRDGGEVTVVRTVVYIDRDCDVLDRELEAQLGTSDDDTDSDDDGIGDYEEVFETGTDPADPDSDGDGLSDGAEVNDHGTDPLSGDTDGDGLPDKWEVDSGTDPLVQDANSDPDQDGLVNTGEYAAGSDPRNPDTDDDGLLDGPEVTQHGTDPTRADTDGDGYSDRYELDAQTDPTDPASAPDGPITLVIPHDAVVEAGGATDTSTLGQAWGAAEAAPVGVTHADSVVLPWSGAVLRLRMDETSGLTARDASGNGHDATVHGPIPGQVGPMGGAYDFRGKGCLLLGNPPALNFAGQITLSAWIRPRTVSGIRNIVSHGYRQAPNAETALRINNGRYEAMSWNGGSVRAYADIPQEDVDSWVHLAGVYDGAEWRLYRNGVEIAVAAGALGALSMDADWAVGARGTGTERFFDGMMDDVAIWPEALSPEAVRRLYEIGTRGEHRVVEIIDRVWTATDASGAGLAATQVIVVQDTRAPSLAVPADITIGSSNVPVPSVTGEAAASDDGTPGIAATYADAESMLSKGLVLHLSLDEEEGAAAAADVSGVGNDGIVQAAQSDRAGVVRGAYEFDGSSCVKLGNPSSLNFSGQITMAAWVYPRHSNGIRAILSHGHRVRPNAETVLRIKNGRYEALSWNGANHIVSVPMPSGDLETWVHLVGVHDGTAWRLYRNGAEIGATVDSVGALTMNAGWAVGSRGTGTERFFDGFMDEVAIWDRALSSNEVATLYGAGAEGRTFSPARSQGDPLTVLRTWTAEDDVGNVSRGDQTVTVNDIDGDPDGDGITSYDEYALGTDPGDADTDDDGLSDGDELNVHGTDPFTLDSDGDGFRDGYEVAMATDPLDESSAPAASMVFTSPPHMSVEAGPGQTEPAATGEPETEANVLPLTVTYRDTTCPLKDGNVLHLTLDGTNASSGARDASLEGNHAVAAGTVAAAGAIGGAYDFDGASCLRLGNPDSMNVAGEITLAAWIKSRATGGLRNIVSHGYRHWPHAEVSLRLNGNNYQVLSWNGANHIASAPMPSGDLNSWVHLAGVYDGASWRLYRNGIEIASAADGVGALAMDADWAIGARGTGTERFFDGLIDDAAVWGRALTAGEIAMLHRLGERHQTFLSPDETRTITTTIREWTAQDGAGQSFSGEQTIWVTDTTSPDLVVPADVSLASGQAAYPAVAGEASASDNSGAEPAVSYSDTDNAVSEGLLLHLPLDEAFGAAEALDVSGNQHTGALHSVTSGVTGVIGHATEFGGSGHVALGNPASLNFAGRITLAAWILPRASDGIRNIISHGHRQNPNAETGLRIKNRSYQVLSWNGAEHVVSVPIPSGDMNSWVHLAGTYDGSAWRLYRNGEKIGSTVDSVGALAMDADWAIGARGTGAERFFDGVIDDVGIWNRALSAEEIGHLHRKSLQGLTFGATRSAGSPFTIQRTWTAVDAMLNATASVQAITVADPGLDADSDGLSAATEYFHGTDPGSADSDGDDLADGAELAAGADPLNADTDGDGLSDGDEVNTHGSDPLSADTDEDTLSDYDEVMMLGTDPTEWDTDGETLGDHEELQIFTTDPLDTDSDDDGLTDAYLIEEKNGADTSARDSWHQESIWFDVGTAVANYSTIRRPSIYYDLFVPSNSMYRLGLRVTSFDSEFDEDYTFLVDLRINGYLAGTYKIPANLGVSRVRYLNTPWMFSGTNSISLTWQNNANAFGVPGANIKVETVSFYGVDAPDADGNGVQDWMEQALLEAGDTDGDGISDYDEALLYGTSPVHADTDGDGLSDGDEVNKHGTNPLLVDTDGDGITDGEEVLESYTDPHHAEFDGNAVDALVIPGAQTNATLGHWVVKGTEIEALRRRGWVEYVFDVATNDIYRLKVMATHPWLKTTCSQVEPVDRSDLMLYLDGRYLGRKELVAPDGIYSGVKVFTPWLTAGQHTVRIFWENVHSRISLRIKDLRLQTLPGPDSDGDGVKDWVETSVGNMTGIDGGQGTSIVSPVCLEGRARYVDMMGCTADGGAVTLRHAAGERWYADVPLSSTGSTDVAVTFQDGALGRGTNVTWVAHNVLRGGTLKIRKGDALMLSAVRPGALAGNVEVEVMGVASYASTVAGAPIIHAFTEPGNYVVNGVHDDGQVSQGSITVEVVGGGFPEEPPALLIGKTRTWGCTNLPAGVALEADDTVSATLSGQTATLRATRTNGDHYMVARLFDDGPILDSTPLDTFWIQAAVDSFIWVVAKYADSELWQNNLISRNVPDTVDIRLHIFIGGVTFEDLSLEKWITAEDINELEEYTFRMIHPNSVTASACHTIKAYQDGVFIGEAYYSGRLMPDE